MGPLHPGHLPVPPPMPAGSTAAPAPPPQISPLWGLCFHSSLQDGSDFSPLPFPAVFSTLHTRLTVPPALQKVAAHKAFQAPVPLLSPVPSPAGRRKGPGPPRAQGHPPLGRTAGGDAARAEQK